ncbi:MAG: hypothetical protein JWP12_2849 [Bacteroidetes bacterium]|nr:hypothetical protein [Bacteroidota bacterium]
MRSIRKAATKIHKFFKKNSATLSLKTFWQIV